MWTVITLALVLCAGAGLFAGAWRAAQDPAFMAGLVKLGFDLVAPEIIEAMRPKNLTTEERDRLNQGLDPFRKRPREH